MTTSSIEQKLHDILVYDGYAPKFETDQQINEYYDFLRRAQLKIAGLLKEQQAYYEDLMQKVIGQDEDEGFSKIWGYKTIKPEKLRNEYRAKMRQRAKQLMEGKQ